MRWSDRPCLRCHPVLSATGNGTPSRMLIRGALSAKERASLGLIDRHSHLRPVSKESDATGPRLMTFVDYHQRILAIRKECFFLSYPYLNVLLELAKSRAERKKISVTGVGLETDVPPTTVLRALGELENIGIIKRVPDPDDRRRVYVDLTTQGVREVSEISDKIMQIVSMFSPAVHFG